MTEGRHYAQSPAPRPATRQASAPARRNRIIAVALIVALGAATRLWLFGAIPGGLNQDEAFAGYEAHSLITSGADTAGYPFPMYLTTWGSGMNALETYLMIPFVWLFGLEVWVIRIPQLVVGILSIWVTYLAMARLFDYRTALVAALIVAVCPWHVMLSRWGLESNLAPGFLLFSLYFYARAMDDVRFLPVCALLFGLSLYTYAVLWFVVPFAMLALAAYGLWCGRIGFDGWLWGSVAVFVLLMVPIALFALINFGLMDEVVTPVFSIPRLVEMRGSEVSLEHIPENARTFAKLLLKQTDGFTWNDPGGFGLLYWVTLPFSAAGAVIAFHRFFRSLGRREFDGSGPLVVWLVAGCALGLLVSVNVNRVNIVFLPLALLAAVALGALADRAPKVVLPLATGVYVALLVAFMAWYTTVFPQVIAPEFNEGAVEAIRASADATDGEVYVSNRVSHPVIAFASGMSGDEFRDTIEYWNYPSPFLAATRVGQWRLFDPADPIVPGATYVISPDDDPARYEAAGYALEPYGTFYLALPPESAG